MVVDRVAPGARLGAVGLETVEVDIGCDQAVLERVALRLGQTVAVLVDQRLTVPGEVGGRLSGAGGGVEVGAERAGRMRRAQGVAVLRLADDDVAGRQVGEDRRARERAVCARRDRGPDVLADLDVDREVGDVGRGEQEVVAEGDGRAIDLELRADHVARGAELPLLIELPVFGQIALRDGAEDSASVDHDGRVE